MHVLQWIAVSEEEAEDAFNTVKNNLEAYMGDEHASGMWYDWFVAGGGRFNPDESAQYDDNLSMIISDKEEMISKVVSSIDNRMREFNDYRKSLAESDIDINAKLDSYDGTMDYSFELYPLKKCIDMLQGEWDFNSYFFDMQNHSTNPKYFLESLDKGDKIWYLIPVDFHF